MMRSGKVRSLEVRHCDVVRWASDAVSAGVSLKVVDAPPLAEKDARAVIVSEAADNTLTVMLAYTDKSVRSCWRYASAVERWLVTRKRRIEIDESTSIHSHKSKFRGCKSCGAQLPIARVDGEQCPLCGADLRSASLKSALDELDMKLAKLKLLAEAEASGVDAREERVVALLKSDTCGKISLPESFSAAETPKQVDTEHESDTGAVSASETAERRSRPRTRTPRKSLSFDIETHSMITALAEAAGMPKSRYIAELVKEKSSC